MSHRTPPLPLLSQLRFSTKLKRGRSWAVTVGISEREGSSPPSGGQAGPRVPLRSRLCCHLGTGRSLSHRTLLVPICATGRRFPGQVVTYPCLSQGDEAVQSSLLSSAAVARMWDGAGVRSGEGQAGVQAPRLAAHHPRAPLGHSSHFKPGHLLVTLRPRQHDLLREDPAWSFVESAGQWS